MRNNNSDRRNGVDSRGPGGEIHPELPVMKRHDVEVGVNNAFPVQLTINGELVQLLTSRQAFDLAFDLFDAYLKTT